MGKYGDKFGCSISISDDGNTVAIGARDNDGINGGNFGHVKVYYNSGNYWTQKGRI